MTHPCKLTKRELLFGTIICCIFILSYFLSFELGTFLGLRIRLEEIATILVLMQLLYLGVKKRIVNVVPVVILVPFTIIYLYSLFTTLVGWVSLSWNLTGFIYLIRDLQYFAVGLLFFIVLSARDFDVGKKFNAIDKTIILSVCMNVAWSIYQLVSGDFRGHYATAAIGLDGSSASSGISYYAGLVFIAFLYAKTERKSLLILVFLSFAGILLTSNRTFSMAALLFLMIWLFLFYLRVFVRVAYKGKVNKTALLLPGLMFPVIIGFFILPQALFTDYSFYESLTARNGVISRFSRIEDGVKKRYELVAMETEVVRGNNLSFYLGNGKGQYEAKHGKLKMGMHSQFSRLINEIGVIGVLMWTCFFCALVFTFSQSGFLSPSLSRVAISFVISFYSSFFSYDVLLISKSAFLFWIFIFVMFAYSRRRLVLFGMQPNSWLNKV